MAINRAGYLYAVMFDSGVVKIGMSRVSTKERVGFHKRAGLALGWEISEEWSSTLIDNAHRDEKKLINYCLENGVIYSGQEWFSAVEWEGLMAYAEAEFGKTSERETKATCSSGMKTRPIRMTNAEWSAFKDLLGAEWLRGQIAKAQAREERKAKESTK
ncbi:MAG TPA: hypothetical protein VFM75_07200 [Modicisalibacter sp.]|nr:hypothetical protein [Modicisalibacter sp.]